MLILSHLYLAASSVQNRALDGAYLAGAIAPDVRYMQEGLARETTHAEQLGASLPGPFGEGYRHHLAVDQAFYGGCRRNPLLRRLGPLNVAILAELHALGRLPQDLPALSTACPEALQAAGVDPAALAEWITLANTYVSTRSIHQAIRMASGPLKERGERYLAKWELYGSWLSRLAWVSSPLLARLFKRIQAEIRT